MSSPPKLKPVLLTMTSTPLEPVSTPASRRISTTEAPDSFRDSYSWSPAVRTVSLSPSTWIVAISPAWAFSTTSLSASSGVELGERSRMSKMIATAAISRIHPMGLGRTAGFKSWPSSAAPVLPFRPAGRADALPTRSL